MGSLCLPLYSHMCVDIYLHVQTVTLCDVDCPWNCLLLLQLLELGYLIYLKRWFYPIVCGSLNVFVVNIFSRFSRAQQKKVMDLVNVVRVVPIVSNGYVHALSSHKLVPGDIIVLQKGKATCDMVCFY